jgi:ribosomal protein S12 methylthiotransferase
MTKTYSLISLGCAKNQVDSERLKADLSAAGLEEADEISSADFVFINTCGFIEPAKKEAIETIFDAVSVKEESGGRQKLIVFGCLIKRYRDEFEKEIPEVDCWYGLYDAGLAGVVAEPPADGPEHAAREPLLPGLAYEYIKIAEGCSNNCSYCAIPLIRVLTIRTMKQKF